MLEEDIQKAVEYKRSGYNCCQAVAKALCYKTPQIDEETLTNIGAGFAGGMGCMEATCGALIGADIMLGLVTEGKRTVGLARILYQDFVASCGASACKDLKGRDSGVVLCPCDECVANAVKSFYKVTQGL
jgi:hypothetical protein